MKKVKEGLFIFLIFLILLIPILTAEQTIEDKAFACLEKKVISNKCVFTDLESKAFSLLALSYNYTFQQDCKNAIGTGNNNECWPSTACNIKDTAQAVIALNSIGVNTSKAEQWLLNKKSIAGDLEWYLEIDSTEAMTCTLNYEGLEKNTITIGLDKKITGTPGECMTYTYSGDLSGYFLKISPDCLAKTFLVKCDKDFFSSLLYKSPSSDIWYVVSPTQVKTANQEASHTINFYCFGTPCDYKGSLWATLALHRTGHDTKEFIPYLKGFSGDYSYLFPQSFLNIVAGGYASEINLLREFGFWDIEGGENKYYETALGILSLHDVSDSTYSKLGEVQKSDGCWNTERDTAFILWAGFSKSSTRPPEPCANVGGYCINASDCAATKGTITYDTCDAGVCCDEKPLWLKKCGVDIGTICTGSQSCNGTLLKVNDTSKCCDGNCVNLPGCIENNYFCVNSETECDLASGTEKSGYFCNNDKFCCSDSFVSAENCSEYKIHGDTGKFCPSGQFCDGDLIQALDGLCCIGDCILQKCIEDLKGEVCAADEECTGTMVNASDNPRCCLNGICTTSTEIYDCLGEGYYCMSTGECEDKAKGNIIEGYSCADSGRFKICCDSELPVPEDTCFEMGGEACQEGEECSEATVFASDEDWCCLADCQPITELTDCEKRAYQCKSSCGDNEESNDFACDTGKICCQSVTEKSYWWLWLLIILIILIVLVIIFRDRLRILLFKIKEKFNKSGKKDLKRPPFIPPTFRRPFMPQRNVSIRRTSPRPVSKVDKELNETLRKLRDISTGK